VVVTPVIGRKVKRMDKKCRCGENAILCGLIRGGKETVGYICHKCGIFYTKKEAKNLESLYVYQ
jgi:hypothetical protein